MENILLILGYLSLITSALAIVLVLCKYFKKLVKTLENNKAKIESDDLFFLFIYCLFEIFVSLIPAVNIYEILQCSLYLANMIEE